MKPSLAIVTPKGVPQAPPSIADMKPALKHECDRIAALFARADLDEIRTRYEAGVIIKKIKIDEDHYGTRAVTQLAVALERDTTTLYRYALVAEAWSPATLAALLRRRMPSGATMTWSHLIELASIKSASVRARMLEMALTCGLSVREIGVRVRGDVSFGEVLGPRAVRRLRRIVHHTATTSDRLKVDDACVATIVRVDPAQRGEAIRLLGVALDAHRGLQRSLAANIVALEEAERRLRVQATPPEAASEPLHAGRQIPRMIAGIRRG